MQGRITAAGLGPRSQDLGDPHHQVLLDPAASALPGGIPDPIDFHLQDDRRRFEAAFAHDLGRARQFS